MLKHNSKITFLPSPINSICLLHARMIRRFRKPDKTIPYALLIISVSSFTMKDVKKSTTTTF
jgi:hypothetical protein